MLTLFLPSLECHPHKPQIPSEALICMRAKRFYYRKYYSALKTYARAIRRNATKRAKRVVAGDLGAFQLSTGYIFCLGITDGAALILRKDLHLGLLFA